MKKILSVFLISSLLLACSPKEEENTPPPEASEASALQAPSVPVSDEVYSFELQTLTPGCSNESQMICAVNLMVKCTINPDFAECTTNKDKMPKFTFMVDESLGRPTKQTYQITKIKPLPEGLVEVYTKSECDGKWFGLCKGNIIYVMQQKNNLWTVKDVYAVES